MASTVATLLLAVAASVVANEDSIAKVSQGTIQGVKKTSPGGHVYHSFSGIRYAKAPVGKLRFKLPEPQDEKWEGVLQATEEVKCWQLMEVGGRESAKVFGQDDCLALNVYTKNLPSTPPASFNTFPRTLNPNAKLHLSNLSTPPALLKPPGGGLD